MAKVPIRVVAADITTGRRLIDVPFTKGTFDDTLNATGNLSVTVPLYNFDVRALDLDLTGAPAHTLLGCTFNDSFVQGGPIWSHKYDKDKRTLELVASNSWSYFNYRPILPPGDANTALLNADGSPNAAMNTSLSNLDLGSIARFIAKQANDNGGLPIIFQDSRTGTSTRNYLGSDLKTVASALEDLTGVINGPDIRFDMGWTADRLGIQIRMRTGTDAQPRLFGNAVQRWDYSVKERSVRNLNVSVDAQELASVAWATGGRVNDILLMDRRDDGGLLQSRGYPRMDMVDSSHSSVSDIATLQAYGQENLRLSSATTSFWEFEVRTDKQPYFGTYSVGDYCIIKVKDDPYINDGSYMRRIVSISGDLTSKWVKITTGVVVGA